MLLSKSDAFSATATFYFMLTGKAPWNVKYDDTNNYQIQKKLVRDARKQPLDLTNIPAEYQALIKKGLTINSDDRASIKDLLKMIANPSGYTAEGAKETTSAGNEQNNGNTAKPTGNTNSGSSESTKKEETETSTQDGGVEIKRNTGSGGGFKDVARMDKLKQELTNRVIWINMLVNGSDLGSTYIHGTQGKIAELFKKAKANAPIIVCFDEFVEKTDGYASSDIAFIVNEAAMMAALADRKIEHQDIINSINCNPSSLKTNARIKVGFKN